LFCLCALCVSVVKNGGLRVANPRYLAANYPLAMLVMTPIANGA